MVSCGSPVFAYIQMKKGFRNARRRFGTPNMKIKFLI